MVSRRDGSSSSEKCVFFSFFEQGSGTFGTSLSFVTDTLHSVVVDDDRVIEKHWLVVSHFTTERSLTTATFFFFGSSDLASSGLLSGTFPASWAAARWRRDALRITTSGTEYLRCRSPGRVAAAAAAAAEGPAWECRPPVPMSDLQHQEKTEMVSRKRSVAFNGSITRRRCIDRSADWPVAGSDQPLLIQSMRAA